MTVAVEKVEKAPRKRGNITIELDPAISAEVNQVAEVTGVKVAWLRDHVRAIAENAANKALTGRVKALYTTYVGGLWKDGSA